MPSPKQLVIDTRLSQVSVDYKNDDYIAEQVLPTLLVPKQHGKILENDMSALQPDANGDDKIGMGQRPGIVKAEFQDDMYGTFERAKGVTIHDDEVDADNAEGAPYEVKVTKTNLVTERLLLNREVRVAAICAGVTGTSSPGTKWDQANSTPLADINAAKFAVKNKIGKRPNYAIVPWEVMEFLKQNADVKSFITGGSTTLVPGVLNIEAFKLIFGVENILVPASSQLAGAMSGAFKSGTLSSVWSDNVTLFWRPNAPMRQAPAFGYTYVWQNAFRGAARSTNGQVITQDYETRERTLYLDARTYSDERKLIDGAAYTLTNVLNSL